MLKKNRSLIIGLACLCGFLMTGTVLFFFGVVFPKDMRNDYERMSNESYDTLFLSMYPIDNYEEERYAYWRGMDTIVTSHEIPNLFILEQYLKKAVEPGTLTTVYLGVRPEKIDAEQLANLLITYPTIRFEVILPYPRLDYWLSLSEEECDSLLQTYRDFIPVFVNHGMMSPYFFGDAEWIIANPANYEDDFLVVGDMSETLMLHSDRDHEYVLTGNTLPSPTACIDRLAKLIETRRTTPADYPDLSDWNIVFLGDSVIGNYTNTTCIPSVVGGLTGANVYNAGYGGGSITEFPDNNVSLPDIADAIISKDLSGIPTDYTIYQGLTDYIKDNPEGRLCFVINYGLNDYYSGAAFSADDPYELQTFAGSLRISLQKLKEAYPEAYILINTPNFTTLFNNGTDSRFDQNRTLEDYANAILTIAEEMDVAVLDNYHELGINEKNAGIYLHDGCHPNELGRYLIAQRIALKLKEESVAE